MSKIIYRYLWGLFGYLMILFLFSLGGQKAEENSVYGYYDLNADNSIVHFDDNSRRKNTLSFDVILPGSNVERPFLAISRQKPSKIFLENSRYDFEKNVEVLSANNVEWYLIPITCQYNEKKLTINFDFCGINDNHLYFPAEYEMFKTPDIYFGTKNILINNITVSNGLYVVAASIFFCLSILIMILHIILRHVYKLKTGCSYISFGFFCLSMWILCDCNIMMSFFNSYAINIIKCVSIFMLPVLLYSYISKEFSINYRGFISLLGILHFLVLICATTLMLFDYITFYEIEQFMWFLFVCSLIVCICCLSESISENDTVKAVYFGVVVMFFTFFIYLLFSNVQPMTASLSLFVGTATMTLYYIISLIFKIMEIYQYSKEKRSLELRLDEQIKYYKILENKDSQRRKLIHDMKNHWHMVSFLLKKQNSKDALSYCAKISSDLEFNNSTPLINTGNPFLDAILTAKTEYALNNKIKVETEIMVVKDMKIDMLDYCVIFGNILDNAIEACEKLCDNRWITIKMLYKNGMLVCRFLNSIDAVTEPDPALKTSKLNGEFHGIGVNNVKETIAKYNGSLQISITEDIFEASFVLLNV